MLGVSVKLVVQECVCVCVCVCVNIFYWVLMCCPIDVTAGEVLSMLEQEKVILNEVKAAPLDEL